MKLPIRRIGNSFGVIVPRTMLDSWGLGEGDHLNLSATAFVPHDAVGFRIRLGRHKRRLAAAVVSVFSANHIGRTAWQTCSAGKKTVSGALL